MKINKSNLLDKNNSNLPDVNNPCYQYPLFEKDNEGPVVNFDFQVQAQNLNMIYNPFRHHTSNILEKHV